MGSALGCTVHNFRQRQAFGEFSPSTEQSFISRVFGLSEMSLIEWMFPKRKEKVFWGEGVGIWYHLGCLFLTKMTNFEVILVPFRVFSKTKMSQQLLVNPKLVLRISKINV